MRLRQLRLLAYGPFSDVAIDLAGADDRLEIVYGPNEAGKSTALRAITGLLYGIDANTPDAHLHPMPKLRIGAELETAALERLSFVRRKGRKDTLLDDAGAVLDEGVLERALGGAGRSLFRALFGLDHPSLREGARELLAGGGDVGESLFDAGGARGVHRVLEQLRAEAAELFTPRAKRRSLNEAIKSFRDARERARAATMSPQKWAQDREAVDQMVREHDELRDKRQRLSSEQGRLRRALAVLRLVPKRRELEARLAGYREARRLPEDARERRLAAEQAREVALRDRARMAQELDERQRRAAELEVPERLLALDAASVDALQEELAATRASQLERPQRAATLARLEEEIAAVLRELGRSVSSADPIEVAVEVMRVDAATLARIEDLAQEHARLGPSLEDGERRLREIEGKLAEERRMLGELPATTDVAALEATAARARRERDGLTRERNAASQRSAQLVAERRDRVADLRALEGAGEVPSEQQLAHERDERDRLWRGLRERGTIAAAGAEAYEGAVRGVDQLADRLRREADRVLQRARLAAEIAAREEETAALGAELADLDAAAQRLANELAPLAGGAALPLDELVDRLDAALRAARQSAQDREHLVRTTATRAEERSLCAGDCERRRAELARWQGEWALAMARLGLDAGARVEEARAVRGGLERLFARAAGAAEQRAALAAIDGRSERLAVRVRDLGRAHPTSLSDQPPEAAAAALAASYRRAREAARQREEIDRRVAALREEDREAAARLLAADDLLAELVRSADVGSVAELEQAEVRSQERALLERRLAEVEDALLEIGGGATLPELLELARDTDADQAAARDTAIDVELEQIQDEIDALKNGIARSHAAEEHFAGREGAYAAEADAQAHLATVRRLGERYLRVRLAAALLEQEVERYRRDNQGPLLRRASELFPELTLGRYRELRVEYGEGDAAELRCVRDDGADLGVAQLSDGTCDQLYLALRLASIERYCHKSEPLPLVLDDVLGNSDDDRARAAMRVLQRYCKTTQVLFFTHHAHLVRLAHDELGDRMREHRLRVRELESPRVAE